MNQENVAEVEAHTDDLLRSTVGLALGLAQCAHDPETRMVNLLMCISMKLLWMLRARAPSEAAKNMFSLTITALEKACTEGYGARAIDTTKVLA